LTQNNQLNYLVYFIFFEENGGEFTILTSTGRREGNFLRRNACFLLKFSFAKN